MTSRIPDIVYNWAQRAFEGSIVKHEGRFYRAGDTYSVPAKINNGPGPTMDIMLYNTVRVVEELQSSQVQEVDLPFTSNGREGIVKGYRLID